MILSLWLVLIGSWLLPAISFAGDDNLTQKEIADLAKSSVVRIIQKVKGAAIVPEIEVDFKSMTVKLKEDGGGPTPPFEIQVDDYFSGSGVIVRADGYIMTNSHVVSYQSVKNLIVADFIYEALEKGASTLSEEELKEYVIARSEEEIEGFAEKISDFILEKSEFDLEKNITVLNPALKQEKFEDLVAKSFPASIVSVNDNFYKDDQDFALIKIEQDNLPALSLGKVEDISVGKKVYIYGYPTTATMNTKDNLEPTFTEGTLSATKDSKKKDFKIFQTDAKISSGSSGGPLLDDAGRVVGLVTFITAQGLKQEGDSFAFALPINIATDLLKESALGGQEIPEFRAGEYENKFRSGISLLKNNECGKAIENLSIAKAEINENFKTEVGTDEYIKQCEAKIQSGESLDSGWAVFKSRLSSNSLLWIGGLIGLIIVLISAIAWVRLFYRVRQDERELDNVEEYLNLNLEDGTPKEEESKDSDFLNKLKP